MNTDDEHNRIVLVVEDNSFNRDGLVLYLQSRGYKTLEAGDLRSAVELAARELPPLAIVDIVLPESPGSPAESNRSVGLELVRLLKQMRPNMGIVVFSAHDDRGDEVWAMIREGMRGIAYLLKGSRAERILAALEEVAVGGVFLGPKMIRSRNQLAEDMIAHLSDVERPFVIRAAELIPNLTPRQYDVAQRVAGSHTNASIARALGLAPKTIESYIANSYKRLGLSALDETTGLRKSTLLAKAFILYQLKTRR